MNKLIANIQKVNFKQVVSLVEEALAIVFGILVITPALLVLLMCIVTYYFR